jgi:hypothetical protein
MSDTLKKVKAGDPLVIPAATFNTFVDAARDFLARQHRQTQSGTPSGRHNCIVLVRNGSGADREDPAAKAIVKKPVAVYIERVYDEGDFAALGIGV